MSVRNAKLSTAEQYEQIAATVIVIIEEYDGVIAETPTRLTEMVLERRPDLKLCFESVLNHPCRPLRFRAGLEYSSFTADEDVPPNNMVMLIHTPAITRGEAKARCIDRGLSPTAQQELNKLYASSLVPA